VGLNSFVRLQSQRMRGFDLYWPMYVACLVVLVLVYASIQEQIDKRPIIWAVLSLILGHGACLFVYLILVRGNADNWEGLVRIAEAFGVLRTAWSVSVATLPLFGWFFGLLGFTVARCGWRLACSFKWLPGKQ